MELSTKIDKYLCNVGIITNSDTELISYGVYLLLGNIASVFFIVLGGLFHKSIIEGLVFLVAFNLVRTKAGGFHLENGNMCFLISMAYLLLIPTLIRKIHVPLFILNSLSLITVVLIAVIAPIDTKNRKLSDKAKKKLKLKVIMSLFAVVTLYTIFSILNLVYFLNSIFLSLATVLTLLLLGIYDNFRKRYYANEVV